MREFFRGWKRKVGCVTLGMAFFLTLVWMRGRIVSDMFSIGTPAVYVEIISQPEIMSASLGLVRRSQEMSVPVEKWFFHSQQSLVSGWDSETRLFNQEARAACWPARVSELGLGTTGWSASGYGVTIDEWAAITIMTAISAGLLFSRPKPKNMTFAPAAKA